MTKIAAVRRKQATLAAGRGAAALGGLAVLLLSGGMNLFLASYRFNKPLPEVYRSVVPMLLVLLAGVLLITYVPILTTALPRLLGR